MKKNKKGFSLIELMLTLGIILSLAVAAFIIYPKVSSSSKAQAEALKINEIKTAIMTMYNPSADYEGLNTAVAIRSKIFPESMLQNDGTNALNIFKGSVLIGTSTDSPSGTSNSAFTITYNSIPPAECVKLVSAVSSNFYQMAVNNVIVKSPSLGTGAFSGLNISTLSSECNKGNSSVIFTSL